MEASQFVGAAKVVETPVTATVTATITAEASHELEERNEISSLGSCLDKYWTEQLNKISSWGSNAQIDPEQEQLSDIFEVEEAAQTDPELEQLNHGFSDTIES